MTDIPSHQSGPPQGQEAEEQGHGNFERGSQSCWGLSIIKAHFAIAICSVGCLTLHPTSGFCWPRSTGNRKAYKLHKGALGAGEEEREGRRMPGLAEMGILYPVSDPLCLNLPLLHNHWIQQDQEMMKLLKEKMDGAVRGIKVHVIREERVPCHITSQG